MHAIQLHIYNFLESIKAKSYKIPEELLVRFSEETTTAIKKHFEREDKKPKDFTLYMGNVGRPSCILQMEKKWGRGSNDNHRFLYGNIVESIVLFLIRASGIKILSEQESVKLKVADKVISGRLDIILDLGNGPEVYDIKSASDYSFKSKLTSTFESFVKEDVFGYTIQLLAYAKAKGIHAGGLIFCNKNNGELHVLEFPKDQKELKEWAVKTIERNLNTVNNDKPFKRSFTDLPEIFNKKETGSRILPYVCTQCDYNMKCWPSLEIRSQINSTAKSPKLMWYTKIANKK